MKRRTLQACQAWLTRVQRRVERELATGPIPEKLRELSLSHAYESGWRDYRCVFVLSTGRGGTETLTALAQLSPAITAEHEPVPRLIKASFDAYLAADDVASSAHWHALVLASRDDAVWRATQTGRIYFESNNRLTYLAPALARAFPASRFIHVYREPFAFVRSAMRRRYYAGHNWDFARYRPRPGESLEPDWHSLPPLERCAWLWARVNADAARWMDTLEPGRGLSLRAEELFAGDSAALDAVFALCDVPRPADDLIEEVLGAKLNAQRAGEFPVASQWDPGDRERVWSYVSDVARMLGYTRD